MNRDSLVSAHVFEPFDAEVRRRLWCESIHFAFGITLIVQSFPRDFIYSGSVVPLIARVLFYLCVVF
jgi:hypothetical protein